MRFPLFVSERTFSRPKLTVMLSCLTGALADLARLASTLWSTTRPVSREGCREAAQIGVMGLELSE